QRQAQAAAAQVERAGRVELGVTVGVAAVQGDGERGRGGQRHASGHGQFARSDCCAALEENAAGAGVQGEAGVQQNRVGERQRAVGGGQASGDHGGAVGLA